VGELTLVNLRVQAVGRPKGWWKLIFHRHLAGWIDIIMRARDGDDRERCGILRVYVYDKQSRDRLRFTEGEFSPEINGLNFQEMVALAQQWEQHEYIGWLSWIHFRIFIL
jgi:hypothetical protein